MSKHQPPEVLHIRVDAETIAELDRIVARERADRPGHTISRADVVRTLILTGLEGGRHAKGKGG